MAQDIASQIADERAAISVLRDDIAAEADAERRRLIDADQATELARLRSERARLEVEAGVAEVPEAPASAPAPAPAPEAPAPRVDPATTPKITKNDDAADSGQAKE